MLRSCIRLAIWMVVLLWYSARAEKRRVADGVEEDGSENIERRDDKKVWNFYTLHMRETGSNDSLN